MNSGWCGKTVSIRNTATGASITATVADTVSSHTPLILSPLSPSYVVPLPWQCPGCGYGSLDLSTGAFNARTSTGLPEAFPKLTTSFTVGSESQGVLPISWGF